MAIEMLDVKKNWGKIKAAFKTGPFFKTIPAQPNRHFVQGVEPMTHQAMGVSPFNGKGFSVKK